MEHDNMPTLSDHTSLIEQHELRPCFESWQRMLSYTIVNFKLAAMIKMCSC